MLYCIYEPVFGDGDFFTQFVLNVNHTDDYINQMMYCTNFLNKKDNIRSISNISNFKDCINKPYDIYMANFHYESLKQCENEIKNFKILELIIHPDINFLMLPVADDIWDSYTTLLKCKNDESLNKYVINGFEADNFEINDFEINLNYISFNENDFYRYQNLLKNLFITNIAKKPDFLQYTDTESDRNYVLTKKLAECINIYNYLNYKPLTFEQLRELEGNCLKFKELANLNKIS